MLSPRHQRFVDEYLIDLCATRAAIRAGYSIRTANVQGPRLLKSARVRAAIQLKMDERARRINLRADDVLAEITRIALHRIVVGLGRSYAPKIKMQSKQKALDQLARHLGPYGDKVQAACLERFSQQVQAASASTPGTADVERPSQPTPRSPDHCDWLPPDDELPAVVAASAPQPPPAVPSPKPHQSPMPATEPGPISWPATSGTAATEYDPFDAL